MGANCLAEIASANSHNLATHVDTIPPFKQPL